MAARPAEATDGKPALGLTMFGVTTPCVTAIAEALRADYDCLVFHATGTGGRTMEKLADSGLLAGVIDITTTEVCDLLFGGVLPATDGPVRRDRPDENPLCRLGRRARHGEFLGAGDHPRKIPGPAVLPAQSERHADAHDGGGMPRDRRVDRPQAQCLRRRGSLPDPGKGRVGARQAKAAPSSIRRPTRRCLRHWRRRSGRRSGDRSCGCPCTSTTRISPKRPSPRFARLQVARRCKCQVDVAPLCPADMSAQGRDGWRDGLGQARNKMPAIPRKRSSKNSAP